MRMLVIVSLLFVASGWNLTQATKSVHPRLRLSYKELLEMNRTWMFNAPEGTLQKPTMLLDEAQERLFVGGRNMLYSLSLERVTANSTEIRWPVSEDQVEDCLSKGREEHECANYIKLVQKYDSSHLLACGTGAFNPVCATFKTGHWNEDTEAEKMESGRGRCPHDPNSPVAATTSRGQLYVGLYTDYWENDPALCRLGNQSYTRTESYDRQQLNEPKFVGSAVIPDNDDPADDKVYFFFTERISDIDGGGKAVQTRVARVCANDEGGQRMQVKRWTSFLKTRLICSVAGPNGIDTHFDELEDVFVLTKKDNKNPEIFGLFSTTSNVFKGYAVCVYSMEDIRAAFNGPFAHREQADHHWSMYEGRVPFPRPGSCASKINGGHFSSSKDFPDEVLRFVRTHPQMFHAVRPRHHKPILLETSGERNFTQLAVDHVEAEDGHYNVLYIGTEKSVVLKYITIYNKELETTEEILLEELHVFKEQVPVREILISTKRQHLYVGSELGVAQTRLHQCDLYGSACADCCLARDPYCAWDGVSCSRYYPSGHYTKSRRFRRQDIRHGNAVQQCNGLQINEDQRGRALEKRVYGVEANSTLLECSPKSLQARLLWFRLKGTDMQEVPGDERVVRTSHGLLFLHLRRADAGTYLCQSVEHSFVQPLARFTLEILEGERLEEIFHRGARGGRVPVAGGDEGKEERDDMGDRGVGSQFRSSSGVSSPPCPFPSLPTGIGASKLWYKEFLQLIGYSNFQRVEQYCERVWCTATDKKKKKMKALAPKWRFPQGTERRAKQRAPRHTPD